METTETAVAVPVRGAFLAVPGAGHRGVSAGPVLLPGGAGGIRKAPGAGRPPGQRGKIEKRSTTRTNLLYHGNKCFTRGYEDGKQSYCNPDQASSGDPWIHPAGGRASWDRAECFSGRSIGSRPEGVGGKGQSSSERSIIPYSRSKAAIPCFIKYSI